MKMSIEEFIKRQKEFEGYIVQFKVESKLPIHKGKVQTFKRLVNDKFCNPEGETFKVLEVEILEYVGITSLFGK